MPTVDKHQGFFKRALTFLTLATLAVVSGALLSGDAVAAENGIFVSNEWSKFTTQDPAPDGYVTTETVEARFDDGGSFPADSDLVKVTVNDPNFDILGNVLHTSIAVGSPGGSSTLTAGPGTSQVIFLTGGAGTPITGPNGSIQVISGGVDLVASGALSVVARFDGNATNDPWISVQNNSLAVPADIDQVTYITSEVDTVGVNVTSDLELSGITVIAYETGISTGVFEGYIRLVSSVGESFGTTGPGVENAGSIRVGSPPLVPVTFTFVNSQVVSMQAYVSPTSEDFGPAAPGSTGSIFVANEGSRITDESPAPDGYTSSDTVMATFDDSIRVIEQDTDLIKIIVKDAGADALSLVTGVTVEVGSQGSGSNELDVPTGGEQVIFLTGQGFAGQVVPLQNNDFAVISGGVDLVGSGALSVTEIFSGNVVEDPWVRLRNNTLSSPVAIDHVNYSTSLFDQIPGGVQVTSVIDTTGVTVQADESHFSTGVFYGYVRLVDASESSEDSTGAGVNGAGKISTSTDPVTVSFMDSTGHTHEAQVTVTTNAIDSTVDSEIYVANEWSKLTDESPAPTGYITADDVYATYQDGVRLTRVDSDLVKVIIKDQNANVRLVSTKLEGEFGIDNDNNGPDGDHDNVLTTPVGQQVTIFIENSGESPIAGDASDIKLMSGGTDLAAIGQLQVINFFKGGESGNAWLRVLRNYGTGPLTIDEISYQVSDFDQIELKVKSDLEPGGVTVQADETDVDTAIFHGFIYLVDSLSITTGSTGPGAANAGLIRTTDGPINFEYTDSLGILRQATVQVDVTVPVSAVNTPTPGSATQNRRPVFSGTVEDTGSGLDISEIVVAYDDSNDPFNVVDVINLHTAVFSPTASQVPISTSGAVDGDFQFAFSQNPSADIPSSTDGPVNHIVDWVVVASDLAGNIGIVDADPSRLGIQVPTVKIDRLIPRFSTNILDHSTGVGWNGSGEVVDKSSIRVVFNEMVTNIHASDFIVELDSGALVVPVGVTTVNYVDDIQFGLNGKGVVYLQLEDELLSDETPLVYLQDLIQDLADNFTASGDVAVRDGINPGFTVITSGGSGTGVGDEGPGGLTNDEMTITITSDEPLNSAPTVMVGVVGALSPEHNPSAVQTGALEWEAVYSAPGIAVTGDRAVIVTGIDQSGNWTQVGDSNTRAFTLDLELLQPVIEVSPESSGVITSPTPDIAVDFSINGEISSVNISELLLDGEAISETPVSTLGGTRLVYQLSTPLTAGPHTVTLPAGAAVDAAGNPNTTPVEVQFEVVPADEVTITMGPDSVSLRADETSLVTVSVEDLGGAVPDTVQINLQHDDAVLSLVNPSCAGIFEGGSVSAVQRDQTDTGSWFVCTLPGGVSAQSGVVATFQLRREGPGNPTLEFGTSGATGSAFFENGDLTAAVSTDTLDVLSGTRITGHVTIQGVSDEAVFSSIAPEVTLTPVSGGNPEPVTVPVAADGTFVFESVYDGVYDLTLDAPGTLGRQMTGLPVGSDDIALESVELRGGIVNDDDGMVTAADVSAVTGSFGDGPGELNGRLDGDGDLVDLDGDGFVTGFDISIVMSNVGEQRLQEWTDPAQTP